MADTDVFGFLGLREDWDVHPDVAIMQIPLEMTVSYGTGTSKGPSSTIEASSQVETYSTFIRGDLPFGLVIRTLDPWTYEGPSLEAHLDSIESYVINGISGGAFPLLLGGEHGILLPAIRALKQIGNFPLENLTLVQVDAHADLRDELNGERFSHGTVVRRCLEEGIGRVLQIGVRAFSKEECIVMENDDRIRSWMAKDIRKNRAIESEITDFISEIQGPVWLSIDIDALDPSIVPATGTPVPGGLDYWFVNDLIESLFSGNANVVGADVSEIAPDDHGVTQFTAATIATSILAGICYRNRGE
tara:strand:- start:3939 stop:4847 length:909 start_codon:yes stop_codon:yes gene_type:complete